MNEKLQELTNKIFREGLEKGKAEADKLVSKAKSEAEQMIQAATDEAGRILAKAEKEAAELKKNTESELLMSTKQAIVSVKQKITDIMVDETVNQAAADAFDDPEFVKSLMLKIAENWDKIENDGKDVMFFLSPKEHSQLESFLKGKVAAKIKGGLDIDFEDSIKSGFKLGPKDGSYKLSFTNKDFSHFFKQYLRPRTRKFFVED
ncbi:MAG: hypothetical protein K9H16_02240 [Bacteroidales bacterium]|nr:hypothetical protein [Bacteroidales bacterium]